MKIVRLGRRSKSWVPGKRGTCESCGTRVEFEECDKDRVSIDVIGREYITWGCSLCAWENTTRE